MCSNNSNHKGGKGEMTKAPISLQDLRRRIYVKAKAEPTWRFWGLYVHVCKMEINEEKSRKVDLLKGEKFGFLGFEYRRVRSRNGKWRTHFVPKPKSGRHSCGS